MNKMMLTGAAITIGLLLFVAGYVYLTTAANALPHFFPGFSAVLTKHHVTHAVASFLLGVGCFIFAWFQSGKSSTK